MVRSHVGEPIQFHLGVAQMAARVIWDHEAAGSRPATETNCKRALGCGRSSMAELRDVTPPVPVRLRPVTPKRMCIARRELEWQRTGLLTRMVRVQAPGDAPPNSPLVAV